MLVMRACSLVYPHATRMRYIVTSSVAHQAPPYFSTLTHKRRVFRKNVSDHKMCVLIFSKRLSKTFHILGRILRDIVINVKMF
jgi:hypothetical protein